MTTVLLVDDHAVVREGYRRLLEHASGLKVIAEASNAELAYRIYADTPADVVVMDVNLPGMTGIEATRRLRSRWPDVKVLVFSMHEEELVASRALQAGARGYLTKSSAPDALVDAVYAVARGGIYINREMAQKLAMRTVPGHHMPLADLSPKEFEVFRLTARGLTMDQITRQLNLSQKTVANYQSVIRGKLQITSDAQWVQIAIRNGVLEATQLGAPPGANSGRHPGHEERVSPDEGKASA